MREIKFRAWDDITKKMNDLQQALDMSKKATVPLEVQITNLKKQVEGIEIRVGQIEADLINKRKSIENSYKDLLDSL